ncbi:MAG: uncharacterized membrane-anchored protein YhcB (DUF1043 family) [Gammaproteobacteria bacterium]|jgi:uncharacterized membrane-anchored protein YhcB (DUF1043 family)
MLTLDIVTAVALVVILGVICAIGGYAIAQTRQRREGDGKSTAELKSELSDYKENVAAHFQTTASLLHDMTEQYRSVYEHMAIGAQQLCDAEQATAQIESLKAGLLPVLNTPSEPVEVIDPNVAVEQEITSEASLDSQVEQEPDELDQDGAPPDALDGSEVKALEEGQDGEETVAQAGPNESDKPKNG